MNGRGNGRVTRGTEAHLTFLWDRIDVEKQGQKSKLHINGVKVLSRAHAAVLRLSEVALNELLNNYKWIVVPLLYKRVQA